MKNFPERKLIYGVGFNDSDFTTRGLPSYKAWHHILCRCYRKSDLERHPSYIGCEMGDEWRRFTVFHDWFLMNYKEGWQIDKDILILGNKVYRPEACVYIPRNINSFVLSNISRKGEFPLGVSYSKKHRAFKSQIRNGVGGRIFLGHYDSPHDAHLRWHAEKLKQAHGFKGICESIHPLLFDGLIMKIESLKEQP